MFESLSERIEGAFKVLKGQGRITEINIAEMLKEIRRALVDSDVNYKIAKQFTDEVKEQALGQNVIKSVSPGQMLVKIVNDELIKLMGGTKADLNLSGNPTVILMSGLQGSGKTTFSAKLANFLLKKGKKPLLVACDVYRPAAIMQLQTLGNTLEIEVYSEEGNTDPVKIANNAINHAKQKGYNTVIIDTAGRLAVDEQMMNEIARLKKETQPHEILFVVDSMTGQDAVNTAKAFNDKLDFSGVVLTKLDGDTRGGAALSIMSIVNKPVKFVGTGEKMEAIDVFYPERMAQRILGMGDIVSFVERAQEVIDEDEANRLQKKLRKSQFDFDDFLGQLKQIKKMGNVKDLMAMIPGVGKAIKDIDLDDDTFKHTEAMILSMTPAERKNPDVIDGNKKKRIAGGSGTTVQQVNQLIQQLFQMRQMMKQMNVMQASGKMPKMPKGMPSFKK
jgi:signal recognition particle subunit SRP54